MLVRSHWLPGQVQTLSSCSAVVLTDIATVGSYKGKSTVYSHHVTGPKGYFGCHCQELSILQCMCALLLLALVQCMWEYAQVLCVMDKGLPLALSYRSSTAPMFFEAVSGCWCLNLGAGGARQCHMSASCPEPSFEAGGEEHAGMDWAVSPKELREALSGLGRAAINFELSEMHDAAEVCP